MERASAKRKLEQMVIHKSELAHDCNSRYDFFFFFPSGLLIFFFFLLYFMFPEKFKGAKAELDQSKSCIDLDELMDLLKSRDPEK